MADPETPAAAETKAEEKIDQAAEHADAAIADAKGAETPAEWREAFDELAEAVEDLCLAEMEREAATIEDARNSPAITPSETASASSKENAPGGTSPPTNAESGSVTLIEAKPEKVTLAQAAATPGTKRGALRKFLYGRGHARE